MTGFMATRTRWWKHRDGFSLIEVLVALAVFSMAVIALMSAEAEAVRTTAILQDIVYAEIVAENRMVETVTAPVTPQLGFTSGTETVAGTVLEWTRNIRESGQPDVVMIDIAVRRPDSPQTLYSLTGFRGIGP